MANENIKQNYRSIANAIRNKTGKNNSMTAEEMPAEIESIEVGITPTGSLSITENAENIDVTQYASANANVPIPEGYIKPSGTKTIQANGNNIDVKQYEKANVNVPVGVFPSGTKDITENGDNIDVYNYRFVNVQVSQGGGGAGSTFDEDITVDCFRVQSYISSVNDGVTCVCIGQSSNLLSAGVEYNKVYICSADGSSENTYFELSPDGESYTELHRANGDVERVQRMKVRLPIGWSFEGEGGSNAVPVLIGGTGGTTEGLFLDASATFNLDYFGNRLVEFYDITGQYKLCQYTLNQMYKQASC